MDDFQWPWQYNFPPFFTIQPNLETRKHQLDAWRELILDYYKRSNQHTIDISDISHSPLFNNVAISRSLTKDDVLVILEYLSKSENAEPIDKTKNRWFIFWHTLAEWASIIHSWVQKNGYNNSVMTFYEIINTRNEEFTGLHEDILRKALNVLEMQGKAEVMQLDENSSGVKFFE